MQDALDLGDLQPNVGKETVLQQGASQEEASTPQTEKPSRVAGRDAGR